VKKAPAFPPPSPHDPAEVATPLRNAAVSLKEAPFTEPNERTSALPTKRMEDIPTRRAPDHDEGKKA